MQTEVGRQEGVCILRGLGRCASARVATDLPREPVQLLLAARAAEHRFVPGTCEKRLELAAQQS